MERWQTRKQKRLLRIGRWLALLLLAGLTGCAAAEQPRYNDYELAGDIEAGRIALEAYGCNACHTIPGVIGANSLVGPPLNGWAERAYIAGALPNEPAHLISWIRFPQAIEPGTAMPNLDVTEEDAVNMSAYLYTLRRDETWYAGAVQLLGLRNE
jgi:cytochrome c2